MQELNSNHGSTRVPRFLAVLLILLIGMSGCGLSNCCFSYRFEDKKGSVHYLILGIGLVAIPKPDNAAAILATRVHSLGVNVSDQPGLRFSIGYSSSSVVTIPDGAEDVRVEISQMPGGSLEIETQSAQLIKKRKKRNGGMKDALFER